MSINAYFSNNLLRKKILVVGAGGIGCELIKNLAMGGFENIEVVDLDTIDVSNLNRQFLFRREHVGQPKAKVAAEAAKAMSPTINISYHHDSILGQKFDLDYFQRFSVVLNALDNLARRHVNRLCISGNVPLIDGGTTGYLGQVHVIERHLTECYDCMERPVPKTFPTCTIRNTPSEMIHCITWAKHLLGQLFGEADPDSDVSPVDESVNEQSKEETSELMNSKSKERDTSNKKETTAMGDIIQSDSSVVGTRRFVQSVAYDPQKLYHQFFVKDIEYLLELTHLWRERRPPEPYRIDDVKSLSQDAVKLPLNTIWSLNEWISEFCTSIDSLHKRFKELQLTNRVLTWDKDDEDALRFVAACSNIRAHIFHIPQKSLYDIKSMAGNIIPAIATSNAIIAAQMVIETYKVVAREYNNYQSCYIVPNPNAFGKVIVNMYPLPPNPKCYVCADKREIYLKVNVKKMKQKTFVDRILKKALSMIEPDVIDMSAGCVVVSSDEDENKGNSDKVLYELRVTHNSMLECDDFRQKFIFALIIVHSESLNEEEFDILRDSVETTDDKDVSIEKVSNDRKRPAIDDSSSSLEKPPLAKQARTAL